MKKFLLAFMFMALVLPSVSHAKLQAPDVLDDESIMTDKPITTNMVIGVRRFSIDDVSYDNVDDEEMHKMKREIKDYQRNLAKYIKEGLEDHGYKAVMLDDEGKGKADVIIDGKITMVNLGSFAARAFFGFGTGQCGIGSAGSLVDAKSGETLAKFEHESTSGLSEGYDKWLMVDKEVREMGDDIAEFVSKLK